MVNSFETKSILRMNSEKIKQAFGTLKLKKPTQKAMDEIDEGYD